MSATIPVVCPTNRENNLEAMSNEPAIRLENIHKSYRFNQVLKGVTLRVNEGEFYALTGHNGSGKSTLPALVVLLTIFRPPELSSAYIFALVVTLIALATLLLESLRAFNGFLFAEFVGVSNSTQ